MSPTSPTLHSIVDSGFPYNNAKAGALELAKNLGITWINQPNWEVEHLTWREMCAWAPESACVNCVGTMEPWDKLLMVDPEPMCIGFDLLLPELGLWLTVQDNMFTEFTWNKMLLFGNGHFKGNIYITSKFHPYWNGINQTIMQLQNTWGNLNDLSSDLWRATDEVFVPYEGKLVHLTKTDILSGLA